MQLNLWLRKYFWIIKYVFEMQCSLSVLNEKPSECLKNYFLGSGVNYASYYTGVKKASILQKNLGNFREMTAKFRNSNF